MIKKNKFIVLFCAVLIALLIRVYFARFEFLEGWDESIYAQLGVEFTKKPDFILFYNGQSWLEKPFLIGWITGFIHAASPYNTFLLRSFFSLIGAANLYFVWKISKNMLTGNNDLHKNTVSLLSPIFVFTSYLFLERSTTINTDITLVFGLLGYYLYKDKYWVKLLFLCIAVWSKSVLGFLPLVLDLVLNFKKNLNRKSILENFVLFLVLSTWYIYGYFRFGGEFVQKHFVEQIFSRASTTLESHAGEWWFYIECFIKTSPIAFILLAISIIYALFTLSKGNLKTDLELQRASPILAGLIFFLLISTSKSKLEWYLLPTIFLISPLIPLTWKNANKTMISILVVIFSSLGLSLIFATPFYSRNSPDNIELIKTANCISQLPQKNITLYQNNQNIKEYDNLNSTGGSISSTFRYGGNPAFIYYSNKEKVNFVYSDYSIKHNKGDLVVVSKDRNLDITKFIPISSCKENNYSMLVVD
jgi:hypothetical protein